MSVSPHLCFASENLVRFLNESMLPYVYHIKHMSEEEQPARGTLVGSHGSVHQSKATIADFQCHFIEMNLYDNMI